MTPLIFVKLGGSLITDKRRRYHVRRAVVQRLAEEIARARAAQPGLRLLLAHGSGSFGHVAATESGYDPRAGHPSPLAMAQVGAAASALNHELRGALLAAGVPALSMPPSASAELHGGAVVALAVRPLKAALAAGLVPLIFGDVALHSDGSGGGIASTEALFTFLANELRPARLLLLGNVPGVLQRPPTAQDPAPPLIAEISPATWGAQRAGFGGSHGTDVTGGMAAKVAETLALCAALPALEARIVSGEEPGLLERLLLDPSHPAGTRLVGR